MKPSGNGPIAVLTYHRVDGGSAGFHVMAPQRFAEHVALLRLMARPEEGGRMLIAGGKETLLTFDDGTADHARAAEAILSAGFTATFFVIAGRLGRPGYLSASDVKEISDTGHRIGSHTMSHRPLPRLAVPEMQAELRNSRDLLENLTGRRVDWLALPGGYSSKTTLAEAERCGYAVTRTMAWGYARAPLRGVVPCLPVFPGCGAPGLRRILEGRARLWPYHVKTIAKTLLGERVYVFLRDRVVAPGNAADRRLPT